LKHAKKIIREARRLVLAGDFLNRHSPVIGGQYLEIPRPHRVLRRANRGQIPPPLPGQPIHAKDFLGFDNALRLAGDQAKQNAHRLRILEFLGRPEATGLPLDHCASVLMKAGVVAQDFTDAEIRIVEAQAMFERRMAEGRALYQAMVSAKEIPAAHGTWAFFAGSALRQLLLGIRLPHVLRRDRFLLNLIYNQGGALACIDLHSIRYRGLCRHPV
jgi:hypothetical protein